MTPDHSLPSPAPVEPRTEAGRYLLARWHETWTGAVGLIEPRGARDAILAIEAEAAAPAGDTGPGLREALIAALSVALHEHADPDCTGTPPYEATQEQARIVADATLRTPLMQSTLRAAVGIPDERERAERAWSGWMIDHAVPPTFNADFARIAFIDGWAARASVVRDWYETQLRQWAGSVDRLVAAAPIEAIIEETGIGARRHSTPPERAAIRAEARAVVASWLARDLARLPPATASTGPHFHRATARNTDISYDEWGRNLYIACVSTHTAVDNFADDPDPAAHPVTRATASTGPTGLAIDAAHLERQREWSRRTFGPGSRTSGVVDHIRKELVEIMADPSDITEWVDVVILALDGAWRAGWEPQQIIDAIRDKQTTNEARTWPDWRSASPDRAIEHVRPTPPAQGAETAEPGRG